MCDTQVNGRPHLKSPSLRFPSQFFTECSGDHHGLAEDLAASEQRRPDVCPHLESDEIIIIIIIIIMMASPRSLSGHWSGASRAPPPCRPSPRTQCCMPGSVIRLDISLRSSLTIIYLGHEAPGGVDTFPDEGLQLGALADGRVVKQR